MHLSSKSLGICVTLFCVHSKVGTKNTVAFLSLSSVHSHIQKPQSWHGIVPCFL